MKGCYLRIAILGLALLFSACGVETRKYSKGKSADTPPTQNVVVPQDQAKADFEALKSEQKKLADDSQKRAAEIETLKTEQKKQGDENKKLKDELARIAAVVPKPQDPLPPMTIEKDGKPKAAPQVSTTQPATTQPTKDALLQDPCAVAPRAGAVPSGAQEVLHYVEGTVPAAVPSGSVPKDNAIEGAKGGVEIDHKTGVNPNQKPNPDEAWMKGLPTAPPTDPNDPRVALPAVADQTKAAAPSGLQAVK